MSDPRAHARSWRRFLLDGMGAVHESAGRRTSPTRNNWPHEPLIGNRPTGETVMWTGVSIIMLLAGICAMVWWYASQKAKEPQPELPRDRSAGQLEGDALAAGHAEIFLGGLGADPRADPDGRRDGALRRGRRRLLRHPVSPNAAVQRDAHLARAARHFLDRDGVAGGRPVHRTAGQRA